MGRYHIRRSDREIKDEQEILGILEKGKFVTLALAKDNMPYAVTLSYGFDKSEKRLYLHCAKEGRKTDFVKDNKNVCGAIIEDRGYVQKKCKHKYRTVVFYGEITIVSQEEEKFKAIEVIINHLEDNPDIMMKKVMASPDRISSVNILRIDITGICAKQGE